MPVLVPLVQEPVVRSELTADILVVFGVVVTLVGGLYLILVGHHLLPERVPPRADYLEAYEVGNYVADVAVVPGSPLVGAMVGDARPPRPTGRRDRRSRTAPTRLPRREGPDRRRDHDRGRCDRRARRVPVLVSALAGVVAMVVTGVLEPHELYAAVEWNVIFLLAGVIPLGIALEETGAAAYLAWLVVSTAGVLPTLVVLWLFSIVTGLITEVISNNASIVLLIPVAAAAATGIGANPFAFVMAVTFAASTAFLGPVGYQTNLFVYGPGGYRFSDYFRVGAPLQFVLSIVTVLGIAFFWGV